MRLSPLCDAAQFIGHLETVFRDLWKQWCAQQGAVQPLPDGHPAKKY
jgi:hypothetical protein